ncbi:MAG: nuclear transport factor 2 family protein [Jiangellaceae bacterium]
MADDERLRAWMDGYVQAWTSNDPADIAALFTEDAEYRTEPYATPWRGHAEIVERWLAIRDEPGAAEFSWEPLAGTGDLSAATGQTTYRDDGGASSNLWVIRFAADGRCREFTEWYMRHPT